MINELSYIYVLHYYAHFRTSLKKIFNKVKKKSFVSSLLTSLEEKKFIKLWDESVWKCFNHFSLSF